MNKTSIIVLAAILITPALCLASVQVAQVHYDEATALSNGRKLAVDDNGGVHVCYVDTSGSTYSVEYVYSADGNSNWTSTQVVSGLSSNLTPSLAVTGAGSITIPSLPSGVYFVRLDACYLILSEKVVISR